MDFDELVTAITIILLGFIGFKLVPFLHHYWTCRVVINKMPGPPDYFLLGNVLILEKDPYQFYLQYHRFSKEYKNSPLFRVWMGVKPVIVCHRAESVEKVLSSTVNINKGESYQLLHSWLGTGLITASGEDWKQKRKLLTPAFHFDILKDFISIFNENSRILTAKLTRYSQTDESFDIYPLIKLASLDIICETAMGQSVNAQSDMSNSQFVEAIQHLTKDVMIRWKKPWLHPEFMYRSTEIGKKNLSNIKVVHDFRTKIINNRKKELMSPDSKSEEGRKNFVFDEKDVHNKKRRLTFLDLLLQYQSDSPETITDEEIGDQVDTFIFAGHDTISAAITWTLYLLGHHPEMQSKVQQEIDDLFVDSSISRDLSYEDLNRLPYLTNVIKETMRLLPPVPGISRNTTQEITLCNYRIPKGTNITISIVGLHRDPTIYTDPDTFRPERFDATPEGQSPFVYVPFSAGPRNCIGSKFAWLELKIVLATLLRKFTFETTQNLDQVAPMFSMILQPKQCLVNMRNRKE